MFGRKLQAKVSFAKEPKSIESESVDVLEEAAAYSAVISTTVENVGRTILSGILIIIAAQTAREVIVKSTKER